MKKLKKIANPNDVDITCHSPFTEDVLSDRDIEYHSLSDIAFEKKYRHYVYTPATVEFDGKLHEIQFNFCNNTFCKWYGMPQKKYDLVANKPSRYKLVSGKSKSEETLLNCNYIAQDTLPGNILGNYSPTISNWSVAEEIKRLLVINTSIPIEPDYQFHNIDCINAEKTPFTDRDFFYYKGKSSSNSLKYQCKSCKKNTNILPEQDKNFSYHQQRNDILNDFCKLIMSRTPVKRICEILDISPTTYYAKLEWVYRKCLEFNERHETKVLRNMHFRQININTDMMVYNLNNIRLKGRGNGRKMSSEEKKPMTYIVSSGDSDSGYVFRSDVAYDYHVTMDDIENDTMKYHCDHSYTYLRKNDRLKISYRPQPPTMYDSQNQPDFQAELAQFDKRRDYVEGNHVKPQYTAIAHYYLIKEYVKADRIHFISDDDSTIESSIFKVFSDKFKEQNALYFTCQYEKNLTLEEAGKKAFQSRIDLKEWSKVNRTNKIGIWEIAREKLEADLYGHDFYDLKVAPDGLRHYVRGHNPIQHPLPDKDEGIRWVNLISHFEFYTAEQMSYYIMDVNGRTINNFYQEVRRRISLLERPLVTARGDGRSYIYANYNPKYAQQIMTIFRTFYNFCWTKKKNGVMMTPAQRLGLTNRQYTEKDIIYFR